MSQSVFVDGFAESSRSPIKVVFILSLVRSGSTWLNLVLGSCSWAMNLGEYYRIWKWPGHTTCRLCEADGLSECSLLHGVDAVPQRNAFHFASARSGKRVLIDCSKQVEGWLDGFLSDEKIDVRIVHLVRHPAGFVDSLVRRRPTLNPYRVLDRWESGNKAISDFLEQTNVASTIAAYDSLADDPENEFPKLCDFIGETWESPALRYWDFSHHGLGGNGAPSLFLKGRKVVNYETGDDDYYEKARDAPVAADTRFRRNLPEAFRREAVERPYAKSLAARLNVQWLP